MSFVGLQTENYRNGEFLGRELPGDLSRDQVVLKAVNDGATTWVTGLVLGCITIGALAGAAHGGNTGAAVIGGISAGAKCKVGTYTITCVEVTDEFGWQVIDPNGTCLGLAKTGLAFANPQINFEITDAGAASVVGDSFTITVAAGSGKFTALAPAAVDGSQNAAAILYNTTYMGGAADQKGTVINYGATVASGLLGWGAATNLQIAAATAQLLALGIKLRASL